MAAGSRQPRRKNLKEQPEVQAIAYAVGRQIEKLLAYADGARTYAAIQSVPGAGPGSAGRGTAHPGLR